MKQNKSSTTADFTIKAIKSIIIGAIVGAIVCTLLLLIATFVFVKTKSVPTGAVIPLTIALACISSLIAGFTATKISKGKGMIVGSGAALLLGLAMLLLGTVTVNNLITSAIFTKIIAMLCSGAIGGIIGVNKRKS